MERGMGHLVNKLMNHGFTRARATMFIGEVINNYNALINKTADKMLDELSEGVDKNAAADNENTNH